jgi:hypothetical protein
MLQRSMLGALTRAVGLRAAQVCAPAADDAEQVHHDALEALIDADGDGVVGVAVQPHAARDRTLQ